MSSHFKVAIRIKKNTHEASLNSILKSQGNCIQLFDRFNRNKHGIERIHSFSFDFCFDDSANQAEVTKLLNAFCLITSSYHCVKIYESLSPLVLSSFMEGVNSCIIAYGQTGSGKTYTMLGKENDPGLIPRICEAILIRAATMMEACLASFYEVYNEKVRDLLPHQTSDSGKVRVREHPLYGPYVSGLSWHPINSVDDINLFLKTGCKARSCSLTNMHNSSSRSHAIFTIVKKQAIIGHNDVFGTKLCLVDLAGSEKPKHQSTREQVKEGAHINKSLATLGNVILSLGSHMNKDYPTDRYIPYRNSTLTWLLKDSIGGTARTVMIGTVSASSAYYLETLNTLRYACKAKQIVQMPHTFGGKALTAQSLISDLQSEIKRLRDLIGEKLSVVDDIKINSSHKGSDSNKIVISRSSMTSPTENLLQNSQMFLDANMDSDESAKGLIIEHYKNKIDDLEKELKGYRFLLKETSNQDESLSDEVTFTSPRPLKFTLEKKIELLERQINERKNRLLHEEYHADHQNNNHQGSEDLSFRDYAEPDNSPLTHSWISVDFADIDRPHRFAYSVPISFKKAGRAHSLLSQTLYPKSLKDATRPAFAFLKRQSVSGSEIETKPKSQPGYIRKSILKDSMANKEPQKFEKDFQQRLERSFQSPDNKVVPGVPNQQLNHTNSYHFEDASWMAGETDSKYPNLEEKMSSHSDSELEPSNKSISKNSGLSQSFAHRPKEQSQFTKMKLSKSFSTKSQKSEIEKPKFSYLKRYDMSTTSENWPINESDISNRGIFSNITNKDYNNHVPIEYGISFNEFDSPVLVSNNNIQLANSARNDETSEIVHRKPSTVYSHRFEAADKVAENLVESCFDELDKEKFQFLHENLSHSRQSAEILHTDSDSNHKAISKKMGNETPKSFTLSDAYKNVQNSIQLSNDSGSGSECSDIGQSYKHVNFDPLNTSSATPYGSSFSSQSLINKEVDHFSPTNFWKQNFKLNFEDNEENDNQGGTISGNDRSRKVKKVVRARAELRRLKHGSNSSSASESSPRVGKQVEQPALRVDEKSGFYYDEQALSDMASLNDDSLEIESDKDEKIKNALLQSNVFYSSFTKHMDEDEESVAEEINGGSGIELDKQNHSSDNTDYGDEWLSTPAQLKKRLSFSLSNNETESTLNPVLHSSTKSEPLLMIREDSPRILKMEEDSSMVSRHSSNSPTISSSNLDNEKLNAGYHIMGRRLTFPTHTIKADITAVESDTSSIDNGVTLTSSPSKEALIINVKLIQRSHGSLSEIPYVSDMPLQQCKLIQCEDKTKKDGNKELRNAFKDTSQECGANRTQTREPSFNGENITVQRLLFAASGLNENENFIEIFHTSTIASVHSSKGDDTKEVSTPIESPALSDSFSSDFESDSTVNEKGVNIKLDNEKKTPLKKFLPTMVAHILKPTETGLTQWVLFDQLRQNSVTTLLPKNENSSQSNSDVGFDKETDDPIIKTSDMRKSSWAWTESHKSTRNLARQKFFEPIVIQEIVSEEGTDKTNSDHLKEISEVVEKPSLTASKSLSSSSGKTNADSNNGFSSSLKIHPKLFTSLEIENYDPHMYSPEDKPNLMKLSGNGILKTMEDNLADVKENSDSSEKIVLQERQLPADEQSKTIPSRTSSNAIQMMSPTDNIVLPSRKESWQNSKSDKILESNSSSANDEHKISFDSKDESDGSHFIFSNNSLPLLPSSKTNENIHILEKLFDNLSELKEASPDLFTKEMPASKSVKISFHQHSTEFPLGSDIKKANGHILEKDDDINLLHLDETNSNHSIFKMDHSSHEHDKSESRMTINQEKLIDHQQSSHHPIGDTDTGHVDIFAGRQLNRVSLVESPNKSKIKQISSSAISSPNATSVQNALDTLLSFDSLKKQPISSHDDLLAKEVKENQTMVHNMMKSFFDSSALPNTNETQYHVHSLKKIDSSLIDKNDNPLSWPSSSTGNVLRKCATGSDISTKYSNGDATTTYLSNAVLNELQPNESNKESRIDNQQIKNDIFAGRQLNTVALIDNQEERNQCESNVNQQLITSLPTKTFLPGPSSTKKEPTLSQKNSKEMLLEDRSQVLHGKIVDNDLKVALRKPSMEKTTENPAVHLLSKEHDYLNEDEHNKPSIEHSKLFNNISTNHSLENLNTAVNAISNLYASSHRLKTGSDNDFNETNSNDDLAEENDIFAGRQLQRISCVQLDSNSASKLAKDNRGSETNADGLIKDVVFVHNEPYHLLFGNLTVIAKPKPPATTASSHTVDRSVKNEKEEKDIFAGRELQRTAGNGSKAADSKKSKLEAGLSASPSTSESDGQSSRSPHEIYQETLQSILPAGSFVNSSGNTIKGKGEEIEKTEMKSNHFLSTFNFDTRLSFGNEHTVSTEPKNDPASEKEKSESLNNSGFAISLHQSDNNQTVFNQGSETAWSLERKPKPASSSGRTPNFNAMIDATEQYISFLRQFLPLPTGDWQKKPIEENGSLNDNTLQSYMENLHALLPFGIVPKPEPTKSQKKKTANSQDNVKAEQELRKKFFTESTVDCSKFRKDQDLSGVLHDEPCIKYSVTDESEAQRKSDNNQVESLEVKHRFPSIELKKEKRFDQGSESPNGSSYFQNLSKICPVPFASSSKAVGSNSSQVSKDHKNEAASNPFVYSGAAANILMSNRAHEIEQSKSDKLKSKDRYLEPEDGVLNVTYIDGIPHIQLQLNGDHDEYDEQFDLSIHSDEDGEEQVSDKDQIDEDTEDFDNLENIPSNHIDLDDANADEILYYFDEKEENIVDPSSKMPLSQSLDFDKVINDMPLSNRLSESYPTISESKFKHGLPNYHSSSSQLPSTSASRDSLKLDFKDYFNSQDIHFNEDDDSDTRRKKSVSWSDLSAGIPLEHGPGGGSQHFSPLRSIIKRGMITVEPTNDAEPTEHNDRSFLTSLTQKFNDDAGGLFSNLHDSVMVSRSALNLASTALKNAYVQTDPAPLTRSVSTLTINAGDDVKRFSRDPSPTPSMSMENVKRYQTKSLLNDLMALVHERDTLLESMNSDLSEWKQPRMSYHKDYNRQYMNDQWWKLWRIKNDLDKRIEELFIKVKTHQLSELPYQHINWLNVPHSALLTCSLKPANTAGTFKESSSDSSCPKIHLSPFDYEKKLAQLRRTLVSTSNDLKQTVSYPELQTFTYPQSSETANSDWRYGKFNNNANWTNAENRKVFRRDDESLESILQEAQKVRQLSRNVLRETRESLNMPHLTRTSNNLKFTPVKQQPFQGDSRVDKKIDDEIQSLRDQYRISQLGGRSNF